MPSDRKAPPAERTPVTLASRELLKRAQAGDHAALGRLLSRYLPQLHRWAHRRIPGWARSAVDTGDLVQETVLHTLRNLDSFTPQREGALLGYLRRGLLNRVRDQIRRAGRHPTSGEVDQAQPDQGAVSPLDSTIDRENREHYQAALQRLRATDRTAIVGRIELGYSYEQLALALGKSTPEAARLAVRRALLRLAEEMRGA